MSETKSAQVAGREVTVQVLRVDGKNMSMQFFRQLPVVPYFVRQEVVDDALEPWGRVLYKLPDGATWLVCKRGEELVRACIDLPSTSDWAVRHALEWSAKHEAEIATKKADLEKAAPGPLADYFRGSIARSQGALDASQAKLLEAQRALALAHRRSLKLSELDQLPQLFLA